MARKKYDDLDEMRKDLDELGAALGIGPSGKGKRRAAGPERETKPPAGKVPPEKRPEPGKVLRNRIRTALGLATLAFAVFAHAGDGVPAVDGGKTAPSDSLRALRVMISSEFKTGDAVLKIEDTRRTDSLLRNVPARGPLLAAIRDTALSHELRSRADFDTYWDRLEAASGHPALRKSLAAQDIDKTRIPKAYLFDSSVVVFPGWIVIRKRNR